MVKRPSWGASFFSQINKIYFLPGHMGQIQDIGIVERIH